MPKDAKILVLVIDDNDGIRTSLTILLQAKGYAVITALDGAEGFAQYEKHQPQIVMSDMIMPGHQGVDTIAKIRLANCEIPIIAMSGSIEDGPSSFFDKARDAGANIYLSKPFELPELLAALAQAAGQIA